MKNELMSEMELDLVNGGTAKELCRDSIFLKELGFCNESYDMIDMTIGFAFSSAREKMKAVWKKVGVTMFASFWEDNEYKYNNQTISREQALIIAARASKNPNIDYKKYI